MKKYLFLATAFLLTMSMSLSAQNLNNRRGGNNRGNMNNRRSEQFNRMTPQQRADLMAKELNLTADETAKVKAQIEKQDAERTKQVEEHRAKRGTGTMNRDAQREEFRAMREKQMKEHQAELEKIIGKEKTDKWIELRQQVRDSNRSGRMDGRGNRISNQRSFDNRRSNHMLRMTPQERVDLMTKELDLTTEQATKVKALIEKQNAERTKQVEEHRSQRGTGTMNRTAQREEFRAMREKQMQEHQAELEKIIGKEKVEKWNELRQQVRDSNRSGRMGRQSSGRRNNRNRNW